MSTCGGVRMSLVELVVNAVSIGLLSSYHFLASPNVHADTWSAGQLA